MRLLLAFILLATSAYARDFGQWDPTSEQSQWYARQRMPDYPESSCCGEADAYWADKEDVVYDKDGNIAEVWVTITDDRDDNVLTPSGKIVARPHVEVGTRIEIPLQKRVDVKKDPNPDGHGVVFLSSIRAVYCYIQRRIDG